MGVSSDSTLGEETGAVKQVRQFVPHFVRRPVPGVCSCRGVVQGVTSPVHRFRPQGLSRR